jgi:hypothetical protein
MLLGSEGGLPGARAVESPRGTNSWKQKQKRRHCTAAGIFHEIKCRWVRTDEPESGVRAARKRRTLFTLARSNWFVQRKKFMVRVAILNIRARALTQRVENCIKCPGRLCVSRDINAEGWLVDRFLPSCSDLFKGNHMVLKCFAWSSHYQHLKHKCVH